MSQCIISVAISNCYQLSYFYHYKFENNFEASWLTVLEVMMNNITKSLHS